VNLKIHPDKNAKGEFKGRVEKHCSVGEAGLGVVEGLSLPYLLEV
jgi:hypothetical protein